MASYAAFPGGFLLPPWLSQEEGCDERKNPRVMNLTHWAAILVGAVLLWAGSTSQV